MICLLLSDSYYPYVSGVVRSVALTAGELARRGHRVLVVAPAYPGSAGPGPDRPEAPPVEMVRLPSLPAPGVPGFRIPLPLADPVIRALRRHGRTPDVIHVHSPFVAGGLGLRLRRLTGAPVVFTHHTLYHLYAHYARLPGPLARAWTLGRLRAFCRRVDAVVVPTPSVAEFIRSAYRPVGRVEVIPTGLELASLQSARGEAVRQRLGIPPDAPVVLHVGRLAPEKNVAVLLQALLQVLQAVPQAHAVVVGGGPLRGWMAARAGAAELSVRGRLHVVGPVPAEAVADWYGAADLFVTASTTETQGLVAVEAMAVGVPVVGPDAYGLRDVVAHGTCGLLVAARADALAAASLRLLGQPDLRRRMAEAARREATRYDVAETVSRLLELYADLRRDVAGSPAEPAGRA